MTKIIISFLLLFITACGTIPQDTTPAPLDNNLYTTEMYACGKRDVGLLGCNFRMTDPLSDLYFQIPILSAGELLIKSSNCNFNFNQTYKEQTDFSVSFAELLKNKPTNIPVCNFDIKVFINGFDRGTHGVFSLVDLEEFQPAQATFMGQSYIGYGQVQIREGITRSLALKFKADAPGTIVYFGCSRENELPYDSNPAILLTDLIGPTSAMNKSCIATIGLLPKDPNKPKQIFTFNYQLFSKDVVQLADPVVEQKGEWLHITTEAVVAGIDINGHFKIMSGKTPQTMKRKLDPDNHASVRIITSNGRYGLYHIKDGTITWKSSIVY